ncbi:hypothetical protein CPB83DRAFT_907317 [Crepidotus variabilis]|uniref:Uncharacterized protein n=1 Tax=Crepidotus variabilis TaxID=179855 RepID=A0A9P6EFB7_9AGAR|nr:hypothetical protein CPB83DRAFT_907317 [Crepidotus variabilis]
MPTTDPPARNWWSLSKQPSGRDLHQKFTQVDEKQAKRTPNAVKSPSGFKSLASAIGLKSKKHPHPSLAIQKPPSPLIPSLHHVFPASPSSDIYSAGPASSTRSRVDSIEPPTPVDSHRDKRNSLLTIADDPFAGRSPMIALPMAPPPADPSRLSAYSNPPVNEFLHGKVDPPTFNRVSYASTSSNSHTPFFDSVSPPTNTSPAHAFPEGKKLRPKRSAGSMQASIPDRLTREPSITCLNSRWSPTNTAKSVMNEVVPSRPKLRARGMTDGGHPQMAGFFVKEHSPQSKTPTKPSTSTLPPLTTAFETLAYPRVIVRQASSSRLHAPPTAPPSHSLPATPHSPVDHPNPRQRKGLEESQPGSTSSASSSVSLADEYATASFPFHDKRGSARSYFSHSAQESIIESVDSHSKDTKTVPSSPRSLRKALSQSSLRRAAAPSLSKAASDQPIDKRKQPKFHHPRLPIPPIPLSMRPSTSSGTPFPSNGDPGPSSESRRGSTSSRKRLFSGGSNARPSTASSIVCSSREDDATSLFSLRSDNDIGHAPYRPWAVTTNFPKAQAAAPSSSFWDEEPEAAPSSPTNTHSDYLPQAIMSRDQLAKLEASVENLPERPFRARGFSQTSASTLASSSLSSVIDELDIDQDADTDTVFSASGLSPPPSTKPNRRPTSARGTSTRALSLTSTSPRRPSTADVATRVAALSVPEDAVRPNSATASTLTMRPPSIHEQTSLPPPPRPRLRSTTSTRSNSSTKTIERSYHAPQSNSPRLAFVDRPSAVSSPNVSPLIPAAIPAAVMRAPSIGIRKSKGSLRSGRPKPSVVLEKTIHRRSIMRKPSFLEIDGDTDAESDSDVLVEKRDSLFIGLKGSISPILPGPTGMASSGHGHGAVGATRTGESFLDFARESFDTLRT